MKPLKAILLSILALSLLSLTLRAQPTAGTSAERQLQKKVDSLEYLINEGNYTRIPNNDFENLLANSIAEEVNDKINFWLIIFGILIGFVSGLLMYVIRKERSEIEIRLSEGLQEKIEKQLKIKYADFDKVVSSGQKYFLTAEFTGLIKEYDTGRLPVSEYILNLEKMLSKAEKVADNELFTKIIDELVFAYTRARKSNKIIELIDRYKDQYNLMETTWANAAIEFTDLYEYYGSPEYKKNALYLCEQGLKKVPGYGECQALRIMIGMIDYSRAKTEEDKKEAAVFTLDVINEVNAGTNPVSSFETIKRLRKFDKSKDYKKYLDQLDQLFPEDMKVMTNRSSDYEGKLTQKMMPAL